VSPIVVPPAEACAAIAFMLGWNRRFLPFYADREHVGRVHTHPLAGLARKALLLGKDAEMEVAVGVDGEAEGTALWAWVRGNEQLARAQRFKPRPSLVLRIGQTTERLLVWALDEAVPNILIDNANRRLAYALHTPYGRAAVSALRVPLPGTCLRVERQRPVEVAATRVVTDTFMRERVVGRLKDPPDPDAWRKAKR
jgi:hypothetical protein